MTVGRSIRRQLTYWLIGPLLLLSGTLLATAFFEAQERATSVYDRMLAAVVLSIAQHVYVDEEGLIGVKLPFSILAYWDSLSSEHLYYSVIDVRTSASIGYPGMPRMPRLPKGLSEPNELGVPVYYQGVYRTTPVRVALMNGIAGGVGEVVPYIVIVAETMGQRAAETRSMLLHSAIRLTLLVLMASAIVWFGIYRGLRPLRNLVRSVRRRSPEDLRPISYETPPETKALVDALNAFISRLRHSLDALEDFAGNVGHQLRTPLGVIRTNMSLAMRSETDPVKRELLGDAATSARDLSHLIDQLLIMSRIRARRADQATFEVIDLSSVIADLMRQDAPSAARAGLDLELDHDNSNGQLLVAADPVLIEGLFQNLLDNAKRYAAPGTVVVRTCREDEYAVVVVEDNGPGINPDLAAAAFSRHPQNAVGHGLGLAICADIARHFGGSISLVHPHRLEGAAFEVRLPLCQQGDRVRDDYK